MLCIQFCLVCGSLNFLAINGTHEECALSTQLSELDLQEFSAILGEERVVTDPVSIAPHNVDWLHNLRGQSRLLLRPHSTLEVSRILAHCNQRK